MTLNSRTLGELSNDMAHVADVARGATAVLLDMETPDSRIELLIAALRAASETAGSAANALSSIADRAARGETAA